ncbi:hypothetical protein [Tsukamurella paurometabola]|uniref:Uncharacterized protein n=1 Tax=Tsukamurella paurometabola TaxID=2061 RepID=A0A3P8L4S2_TSUPA|nr:hypothetical protein [Tsukamurella paurometabola]UEA85057.1 hypothetical protein LK411_09680 [Tsukamurella paurometabola]VDR37661.1 Uncharacterised protein [Tsukamurella paurometabola]
MRFHDYLAALVARFGEFRRAHVEMYERHHILLEPWTHDILHWGADGTLHGSVVAGRARPPVTRGGWCPCRPLDAPGASARPDAVPRAPRGCNQ